jgi:hypothetical protein
MPGPDVRATMAGLKTQTRRVVKPQPEHIEWFSHQNGWCARVSPDYYEMVPCPYGVPGDLLWVRETWSGAANRTAHPGMVWYRADGEHQSGRQLPLSYIERERRWRPSTNMPKWASRLWLRITDVRVEREDDGVWLWALTYERVER